MALGCETESKGLTNFLVRRCTSCHRNLQLCKFSCELVWLVSYASLIKEGEEEEEEDDEQCGKF